MWTVLTSALIEAAIPIIAGAILTYKHRNGTRRRLYYLGPFLLLFGILLIAKPFVHRPSDSLAYQTAKSLITSSLASESTKQVALGEWQAHLSPVGLAAEKPCVQHPSEKILQFKVVNREGVLVTQFEGEGQDIETTMPVAGSLIASRLGEETSCGDGEVARIVDTLTLDGIDGNVIPKVAHILSSTCKEGECRTIWRGTALRK